MVRLRMKIFLKLRYGRLARFIAFGRASLTTLVIFHRVVMPAAVMAVLSSLFVLPAQGQESEI